MEMGTIAGPFRGAEGEEQDGSAGGIRWGARLHVLGLCQHLQQLLVGQEVKPVMGAMDPVACRGLIFSRVAAHVQPMQVGCKLSSSGPYTAG
jgi:hypothetical protein